MSKANRYPQDLRERATRMVQEHRGEQGSEWAAIVSIATQLGMTPGTLRIWLRRDEVDGGRRAGVTSDEHDQLVASERPQSV